MTAWGSTARTNSAKAPGRSGIVTLSRASFCSPSTARSATKRKRSKFMFAPDAMATKLRFSFGDGFLATYFFRPARANAPAGSTIDLVSSNTSLIAAQVSSVVTSMISSTTSEHSRNVSSPTVLTAAPSAKSPTSLKITLSFFLRDCTIALASYVSTPMIFTCGAMRLM